MADFLYSLLTILLKCLEEVESEVKPGEPRDYPDNFFPNYELKTLQVSQEYRRLIIRKTVPRMNALSRSAKHCWRPGSPIS
jgi:hypothetical protein